MTEINIEVGQRIHLLREKKGITQEMLAVEVGLTQPAICQIERGKRQHLNPQYLEKIAAKLDVSIQELLNIGMNKEETFLLNLTNDLRSSLLKLSELSPHQQDKIGRIILNIIELP